MKQHDQEADKAAAISRLQRLATEADDAGDDQAAATYTLADPEALDSEAERIKARQQEFERREREQREQRARERAAATERNDKAMQAQREADTSDAQRRVEEARARAAPKDGDDSPATPDRKRKNEKGQRRNGTTPQKAEADLRVHPILPGTIVTRKGGVSARPVVQDDHLQLSLGFTDTTTPPQPQHLPGLEPLTIDPAPVLPLVSWDSAGGVSMTQGRGAALGIRLYIETLLSVPPEFRRANSSPVAVRCKLRQLKDALWPRGWQRNRDWPRLMAGINELRRLGVEWESNGAGGIWFAVTVRNVPRNGASLDDRFVFEVMLPPGSGRGPMVDRGHVHLLGLDSAPAFRLYLALCWYWDYYGTHKGRLIGADVPNPHKPKRPIAKAVRVGDRLVNPAALRWYPPLSRDDLATMAYAPADLSSEGTSYRRDQRARARDALALIAKITGSLVLPTERADGARNCVTVLPSPHYKAAHDAKAQAWANLNKQTR